MPSVSISNRQRFLRATPMLTPIFPRRGIHDFVDWQKPVQRSVRFLKAIEIHETVQGYTFSRRRIFSYTVSHELPSFPHPSMVLVVQVGLRKGERRLYPTHTHTPLWDVFQ